MRDDVLDIDRTVGSLDDFDCTGLRFGIQSIRISQSRARAAVILGDALLGCDDDIACDLAALCTTCALIGNASSAATVKTKEM